MLLLARHFTFKRRTDAEPFRNRLGTVFAQVRVIELRISGLRANIVMLCWSPSLYQVEEVRDHDSSSGAEDRHATASVWKKRKEMLRLH